MARSSFAGLITIGVVLAASCASAETASEIMDRVKATTDQITDMRMRVTLRLDGPSGERVRSLRGFEKRSPHDRKILWAFERPADLAGTSFLAWEQPGAPDLMWVYFPAQRRVRQLSPQLRREQFQGSGFTYEDLMLFHFDYVGEHTLQGEEPCSDTRCYVIQTELKDGTFAYRRLRSWIRETTFLPERIEFFGDDLVKVMKVKRAATVQGIPTVLEAEMESTDHSDRTTVEFGEVAYNTGLADTFFTVAQLTQNEK
jgi:outer membrane lipoprotein-sorting protein